MPSRGQIARVAIDDESWLAFRQAALAQGVSVSAYLGRLVDREVRRRGERPVSEVDVGAPELEQTLAALTDARAAIDDLDAISGRLARSAVAHGGSWDDVASSLRINAAEAERAYNRADSAR